MKNANRMVWIGSTVLAATAAFHGSGYESVTGAASASNLDGMLASVIGPLWLYPTVHWLFLAILAIVVARTASPATPWILGLIAAVLSLDAILLLVYVGPFLGEAMLGTSALAYAVGACMSSGRCGTRES